jgi:hypothetical protein
MLELVNILNYLYYIIVQITVLLEGLMIIKFIHNNII